MAERKSMRKQKKILQDLIDEALQDLKKMRTLGKIEGLGVYKTVVLYEEIEPFFRRFLLRATREMAKFDK